jgi:hypothetical protein
MTEPKKTSKKKKDEPKKKPIKTATLEIKQKQILTRVAKIEKGLNEFIKNIGKDFNVFANRLEKIEALLDRHSTQIRGHDNFMQNINNEIVKINSILAQMDSTEEEIEEEEEEE